MFDSAAEQDLVFTLETLVEKFGEEIKPYAAGLVQNLVAAFHKCIHAGDSADDDDASGALASLGCLRAISTVLDAVSGVPELYPALEELLYPMLAQMLSTDGQDVFEEVRESAPRLAPHSLLSPQPSASIALSAETRCWLAPLPPHVAAGGEFALAIASPEF